jgi:predicted DNA-binding protein (MmcQ/YjbR family)
MREHFQKQLDKNTKVTQEALDKVEQKTYSSGREIKVGDTVLFAVIKKDSNVEMIALHEDELNKYSYVEMATEYLPQIEEK